MSNKLPFSDNLVCFICKDIFSGQSRRELCDKCRLKRCLFCEELFSICPTSFYQKYCSHLCASRGKIKKEGNRICVICSKPYHRPPSQIKYRGSSCCSRKCANIHVGHCLSGEKSPLWKGGISSEYRKLRSSKKWKHWREKVFKRDNWICQGCWVRSEKDNAVLIEPHHIHRYYRYERERFIIANGVTLCKKCHNKTKKFDKLKEGHILEIKEGIYKLPKGYKDDFEE